VLAFVVVFLSLLFILILGINHLLPNTFMGLMLSLAQSLLGLGAFFMFLYYRKIGDEVFEGLHSTIISYIILVVSTVQFLSTIFIMVKY
jgi:hypothetical protein